MDPSEAKGVMISQDPKTIQIMAKIHEAIATNDPGRIAKASEALARMARGHSVDMDTDFEIQDLVPGIRLPRRMALDHIWIPSDLPTLIGGFLGHGKTTISDNIIAHLLHLGKKVYAFVNEAEQQECAINVFRIFNATHEENPEPYTMAEAFAQKRTVKLWLDSVPFKIVNVQDDSPDEVVDKMTRALSLGLADAVFLDYFQNTATGMEDKGKFAAFAKMSRGLRKLCKAEKKPVIITAQINREGNRDEGFKAPGSGAIKGCGDIEEAAGLCINSKNAMYAVPQGYAGKKFLWVNVAKNRYGEIGHTACLVDYETRTMIGEVDGDEMERYLEAARPKKKR